MKQTFRTPTRLSLMGAVAAAAAAVPAIAVAQEPVAKSIAETETTVPGGTLMLAAYVVFVALLFGYLFILSRKQIRVDRDIDALRARLDQLDSDA